MKVHLGPPSVPLIKIKHDDKPDKYFVKIKFHRDPMSDHLYLYEFKMSLFQNGKPERFLLLV